MEQYEIDLLKDIKKGIDLINRRLDALESSNGGANPNYQPPVQQPYPAPQVQQPNPYPTQPNNGFGFYYPSGMR